MKGMETSRRPKTAEVRSPLLSALCHPQLAGLPPPLIVVGMHRSGTSLTAAMLHLLGVHLGQELLREVRPDGVLSTASSENGYGESLAFRQVNDRLLTRAGATWCRIEPFLQRRDQPAFVTKALASLVTASRTHLARGYLRGLPTGNAGPWGWKDPRNSLTLPLWLRLFPNARVLHVRRSPEAAARSLHRRALAWQAAPSVGLPPSLAERLYWRLRHPGWSMRQAAALLGLGQPPAAPPDPCLDPDYCLRLGKSYTRECLRYADRNCRYLEIWFEDLLKHPTDTARLLAEFAGVEPDQEQVQRAARLIRPRNS